MDVIRRLIFPVLLGAAAYYAVFGGEYSVMEVRRTRLDTDEARVTLAGLLAETDSLAVRAEALESDPKTLETLARERFGMIREGEVLYRFADQPGDSEEEIGASSAGR